jgi:hypothetical protein
MKRQFAASFIPNNEKQPRRLVRQPSRTGPSPLGNPVTTRLCVGGLSVPTALKVVPLQR